MKKYQLLSQIRTKSTNGEKQPLVQKGNTVELSDLVPTCPPQDVFCSATLTFFFLSALFLILPVLFSPLPLLTFTVWYGCVFFAGVYLVNWRLLFLYHLIIKNKIDIQNFCDHARLTIALCIFLVILKAWWPLILLLEY